MYNEIISFIVNSIGALGYLGIFILMFLESSFFPFPSEIVMIPAGYLAYQGKMSLILAIVIGILGSIAGAWLNYFIADKFGRKLILRFLKEHHLKRVESFFEKYGHISTFNGRLIPIIRQYISFPAGLAKMNPLKFTIYTGLGAGIWISVLTFLGYFLGQNETLIHRYLKEVTIIVLILISILTTIYIYFKNYFKKYLTIKKQLFSKYVVIFFVLVLLFASGIKIHSYLTMPQTSDWNYHQLQKIDKSQNNFSFAVFGDNKNSAKTFENLIFKLNKDNVVFAVDDGDLVFDGEKEKFRFFLDQIKNLNKPLLTVFGNHEDREQGRANYYEIFGSFYYSFTVGNNYFIILDDSNEKNLDPGQFEWLHNELSESQSYQNRFVFMHVPLYDPRNGQYEQGHSLTDLNFVKKLNNLFDENNVTMLFVSHIHAYYQGVWGKTPYIITGGGGAELAGIDPQHYFYHYIKVNITDSGVKYDIVKFKSPDFELFDRLLHNAWIYIYAYLAINFIDVLFLIAIIYLAIYIVFIKKEWLLWNFKRKFKIK